MTVTVGTPKPALAAISTRAALAEPGRLALQLRRVAGTVLPPLVVLLVIGGVWELAAGLPGSSLPPPSKVWATSHELVLNPF